MLPVTPSIGSDRFGSYTIPVDPWRIDRRIRQIPISSQRVFFDFRVGIGGIGALPKGAGTLQLFGAHLFLLLSLILAAAPQRVASRWPSGLVCMWNYFWLCSSSGSSNSNCNSNSYGSNISRSNSNSSPSWLANSRSVRWTPRWIRPNQDEIQKKLWKRNGLKNWECSNFRDMKIFLEIISGFWENSLNCMMFLTKKIKDQDQHR